jgi:hypothetical protein
LRPLPLAARIIAALVRLILPLSSTLTCAAAGVFPGSIPR